MGRIQQLPPLVVNQIIAGASDEVGHGDAGKNVAQLAQKFSLDRVLIGSVRSQEETRVSIVLALVDAPKHRVIASKTMLLTADGTDADQIEADTQSAARKLISADDEPAADAPRRPVMPAATVDDPGIVAKERKVAVPASTTETAAPENASSSQDHLIVSTTSSRWAQPRWQCTSRAHTPPPNARRAGRHRYCS